MKKIKMGILVCLLVLGMFGSSFAAGNWWNAKQVTINGVQKDDVSLKVGITWEGFAGTAWYHIETGLSYEKELMASLLSAQTSGMKCIVKFNGTQINGVRLLTN